MQPASPWRDVIPERTERRPVKRPPLLFDWRRVLTHPPFPTIWAYTVIPAGSAFTLWVYRQGRVAWRWTAARNEDGLPVTTHLLGTKIDCQLAAEKWYTRHAIPQPTLNLEVKDGHPGTEDDLPF